MLFCFASLANLPALVPLPDGGYPVAIPCRGAIRAFEQQQWHAKHSQRRIRIVQQYTSQL